MGQNLAGFAATGSYSDSTIQDIRTLVTWTVSDTSLATIGSSTGLITIAAAGRIYGGSLSVTATLAPGTPGAASQTIVASDSASISPLMPQRDSHWVALGLSPWGAYGGCQEATGNLVLSGGAGYTLSPINVATFPGVAYAQSVPGFTRVGVSMSGVNGQRINAAAGVGPNPATDSIAMLGYILSGPGATAAQLFGLGAAAGGNRLLFTPDSTTASSGQITFSFNGIPRPLAGPRTHQHTDRVHPFLMVYNRTTSEAWAFTDQCLTMSGGLAAQLDGNKQFGGTNNFCISGTMVYYASCTGSVAESFSNVGSAGALLTSLGWNVAYYGCPPDSGTIRTPFTPYCWSLLGLRPWSAAHGCQEQTGSIASFDVWQGTLVGGWNLVPSLNVTYRNLQAGWLRRSIDMPDVLSAKAVTANNLIGSFTGSVAFLAYCKINTAAGAARSLFGGWNAAQGAQFRVQYGVDGKPQLNCAGSTVSTNNDHRDGRVHPFLIVYDATNSRAKFYTDLESVTGSFGVLNQPATIGIGAIVAGQQAAPASYLYFAVCTGSVAEVLSTDGQASSFLKTLGWTVPW